DLKEQLKNSRNLKNFQPIVIKPEASKADVAFIESHRSDIPLLEMLMVHRRRYLPNGFMSHASGYVGEVSEQQIENSNGRFRPGDVVALDPRTGEILAMTSHPAPDPNDFAIRISNEEWKQLNDDPKTPLLNRAIQAQLAPGSVFKIVTATAMLEDKTPPESFT